MSFVSFSFLALYLAALAVRVGLAPTPRTYVVALLALSWMFYAWHVPSYLGLILFSTAINYVAARLLGATSRSAQPMRRGILWIAVVTNLGLLAVFKYAGFFATAVNELAVTLGQQGWSVTVPAIVLPIGISFYTFQAMSYMIDVYRGQIAAERSFLRVAFYIAFFPQLVAGPIVRAGQFLPQLDRPRRWGLEELGRDFVAGGFLVIRGLFLKVVIADNLGRIVDTHWTTAASADPPGTLALAVLVFFACQLFGDFAGYSSIARGLARQLGFRLPLNFNAPYLATTFSEFWRRWHITLSTWMRDYLYIPLGGSRRGRLRNYANLFIVMLLVGLWHGASWTFVAWGGLFAVATTIERLLGVGHTDHRSLTKLPWYLVVQATWIASMGLFRAQSFEQAWSIWHNAAAALAALPRAGLAVPASDGLLTLGWWLTLPVVALHARALLGEARHRPSLPGWEKALYTGAMLAAILTLYTTTQRFIYFQF